MLVFSHYPGDTRVRREALALKSKGFDIDIICIKGDTQSKIETIEGISIFRINLKKKREGLFTYIYIYTLFFLAAFVKVNFLYFKKRYSFIHVHNMPNFIVFTSLLPKIMGTTIILDMHDPMPELLSSSLNRQSKILRNLLIFEEKMSVLFADKIITTNIAFKELFISRGCPENKISIVMNSPYPEIFNKVELKKRDDSEFIILYNGSIIKRHGLDLLVDAVISLKEKIPNIKLRIYGGGEFLDEVIKKISDSGSNNFIEYCGPMLIDDLVKEIASCDLGVIPNRFNEFTNLNFPIRIFELIHFRKPVIVPRTKGIMDYFGEDSILYFNPNDSEDLKKIISKIVNKEYDVEQIINKSYAIYNDHKWEVQQRILFNIYMS
ncbi:MAG: glycosyltransferase [Ignavibacterium sp.]|jgi:glycosyltransferase involved in cell wall biosynthesis